MHNLQLQFSLKSRELNSKLAKIENTHWSVPKEMAPVPFLSNSWKATMKRASGAHNTDSNARNSWNEISLPMWVCMWYKRKKKILLNTSMILEIKPKSDYTVLLNGPIHRNYTYKDYNRHSIRDLAL